MGKKRRKKSKNIKKIIVSLLSIIVVGILGVIGYTNEEIHGYVENAINSSQSIENIQKVVLNKNSSKIIELSNIPEFTDKPYVEVNNNKPQFEEKYFTKKAFEEYSELDELGRCGVAFANICLDTMPTQERESIGSVKPTGWHTIKYDIVDGKYLYNRCHLIGYQLTAENANKKNLITGTRYLNISGMLPFENKVAEYVKETSNHVLYRVTPIFEGNNLVANGVQIEAESVEDKGVGICFNVYVYNNQPGIIIDYNTGESMLSKELSKKFVRWDVDKWQFLKLPFIYVSFNNFV